MDESSKTRFFAAIGAETASILRASLEAPVGDNLSSRHRPRTVSSARIRQEWQAAWARWEECIGEASQEEGRYVTQDHHWEPPYLDVLSLSDDLDQAVGAIQILIGRVIEDDIDPGFSFADRLMAAVEEIGSGLPEWMDGLAEEFGFGPNVTQCLLESEWTGGLRGGHSPYDFARRIAELEAASPPVPLDGATIARFIKSLGGSEKADVQRGISSHAGEEPWSAFLDARRNHWRAIFEKLSNGVGAAAHGKPDRPGVRRGGA